MYQYVKGLVKPTQRDGRWEAVDLKDAPVAQLTSKYADVVLVITYPALQGEVVHFSLYEVPRLLQQAHGDESVQTWLTNLGGTTLPTTPGEPDITARFVRYINAWDGGYVMTPVNKGNPADRSGSKHDKRDLRIQRDDVTPEYLRKHALFSINGLFHFAEYGDDGVYIHEGNRSIRVANDNQIGVHSFSDIGELNYIDITPDMVTNLREGTPLIDGVYVTFPETFDFKSHTVLLVLGGFLHVLDKTYTRVGRRTYKIELSKLMLPERYFVIRQLLDLSALEFTRYAGNDDLVTVSEWLNDHTIMTLLTLSQTFFVVVKTPSMFQELVAVEHLQLPGRFTDYEFEHLPLMGAYGKMLEYKHFTKHERHIIASELNRRHNYDIRRRPWMSGLAFNGARESYHPFTHSEAYWRRIGTQEQV